ncbi:MAG: hypothetical protein LBT10_02335 [Methanobrevibacter sp.]|jgi:tRNA(Ile2) C34 agmatinyltransferase TiaS|nr:hypothetical protein [Methanobrevibacter sp.]
MEILKPKEIKKKYNKPWTSPSLTFAVKSENKKKFVNKIVELLKIYTLSDKTAIAILEGLKIPNDLRQYSIDAKMKMMAVEEAEHLAEKLKIKLIAVTGDQGKIGALAALGLYNDLDEAVKVYY